MPVSRSKTGKGFGGLARYLLTGADGKHPERVAWTAVRNLRSDRPEDAALQMRRTADLSTRVQVPVYHISLNWSPEDQPTRQDMEETVDRVLRGLGLGEHQALLVAHNDTPHPHVHVMVNRVHPRTLKTWRNQHDRVRMRRILHPIEKEKGWKVLRLPGQALRPATERESARIRHLALEPLRTSQSWAELEERLREHRLYLRGRGRGLVVTDGERFVKASDIHRGASRARLEARFRMPYREWRAEAQRIQKLAKKHYRLTARPKAVAPSRHLRPGARNLRSGARQLRTALEGAGDPTAIEQKLAAFALRFGMTTLRTVSPSAALIVTGARRLGRSLDRERERERERSR
jgi:hypothetical protein